MGMQGNGGSDNVYITSEVPASFSQAMIAIFGLIVIFWCVSMICGGYINNGLTNARVEAVIASDLEANGYENPDVKVVERLEIIDSGYFYSKFKVKIDGKIHFYECESGILSPVICVPYTNAE